MANEDVLSPRKTMFVLVIVVGCFAVLWPRILSPLILGPSRDQLKPNQYDRDAGCCEVIFAPEVAILEIINEVCASSVGVNGKLSPYAAAECRRAVNETCGVDIVAFLKRSDNIGKTTKMLLETMKSSNSSCLKEHFGVPSWSLQTHMALNSWTLQDTIKQERSPVRGPTQHPALRERGRAIPPGAPTPPSRGPVPLPAHVRPPPIPGMRPPMGAGGGPLPTPKSSMGFVMPIYTICIIIFFVYTLSKILFKRTNSTPYDQIASDPQFRRHVFRDDSRSSPDSKIVVTAISGLVAEVQQQMEANFAQSQLRQDVQGSPTYPFTNGKVVDSNTLLVGNKASKHGQDDQEIIPDCLIDTAPLKTSGKISGSEDILPDAELNVTHEVEPLLEPENKTPLETSEKISGSEDILPDAKSNVSDEVEPLLEQENTAPLRTSEKISGSEDIVSRSEPYVSADVEPLLEQENGYLQSELDIECISTKPIQFPYESRYENNETANLVQDSTLIPYSENEVDDIPQSNILEKESLETVQKETCETSVTEKILPDDADDVETLLELENNVSQHALDIESSFTKLVQPLQESNHKNSDQDSFVAVQSENEVFDVIKSNLSEQTPLEAAENILVAEKTLSEVQPGVTDVLEPSLELKNDILQTELDIETSSIKPITTPHQSSYENNEITNSDQDSDVAIQSENEVYDTIENNISTLTPTEVIMPIIDLKESPNVEIVANEQFIQESELFEKEIENADCESESKPFETHHLNLLLEDKENVKLDLANNVPDSAQLNVQTNISDYIVGTAVCPSVGSHLESESVGPTTELEATEVDSSFITIDPEPYIIETKSDSQLTAKSLYLEPNVPSTNLKIQDILADNSEAHETDESKCQNILNPSLQEVDIETSNTHFDLINSSGNYSTADSKNVELLQNLLDDIKIVSTQDLEACSNEKLSTPDLLEEALKEEIIDEEDTSPHLEENASVKHEADVVKSIFLETEIPQQSRVLVTDFAEDRPEGIQPSKHSPLVVSGKMTLSLIQDTPRDTPEREQESTMDEFTTASAVTMTAAEKEGVDSDEEIEEEIEIEEIEEEVEEEEEEEEEVDVKVQNKAGKQ